MSFLVLRLQTPLHKAAWYGYINVCKLLVENGASLFRQDYQVRYRLTGLLYNIALLQTLVCV